MQRLNKLPVTLVTLGRRLRAASRNLWTRVTLISGLGLLAVGMAKFLGPFIPDGFAQVVGADSVTSLLTIIANAMLAVTTFSLSVMVAIHRSVSSQWTPRAHLMLLRDTPTQTVLATFIGAYIFALTSLILLSTPFFGEAEVVVLFGMTLLVIALIVAMILRWIAHLQTWGSLSQTAETIEAAAARVLQQRAQRPCHGCQALTANTVIPVDARNLLAPSTGYIREILFEKIENVAASGHAQIYFIAPIGRFVHQGDVIGHIAGGDPLLANQTLQWVTIGPSRSPDHDARFCLIMLSEMGSKALSPGINDAGTAIDVIGRLARLLEEFTPDNEHHAGADYTHIWTPALTADDLISDAFAAIARDGAHLAEVQIILQKRLRGIARHAHPEMVTAVTTFLQDALHIANDAIAGEADRTRLASEIGFARKQVNPDTIRE